MSAKRRNARVSHVRILGSGLGRVDVEGEGVGVGVEPGQFVMVEVVQRPDCVLPRPLSYFLVPSPDRVAFLVKDVGKGTHSLLAAKTGDGLRLLGPLGKPFPAPPGPLWFVAGGVGAAPCGGFATLPGVEVLFGARTASEAGFAAALEELGLPVRLATDDGSAGIRGTVTALLAARLQAGERPAVVYACGPRPMMAEVARLAAAAGVQAWVSLEERMGCGFGVCRGCMHPDAAGRLRCVCQEGPVFEAQEIFGGPRPGGER